MQGYTDDKFSFVYRMTTVVISPPLPLREKKAVVAVVLLAQCVTRIISFVDADHLCHKGSVKRKVLEVLTAKNSRGTTLSGCIWDTSKLTVICI
jgi:hypothetical protein